jgi:hypothetical protein
MARWPGRAPRWAGALALLAAASTPARAATGAEPPPGGETVQLTLEAGLAHETQRAPLVQFSPQDTPIYLPGVLRLGGPQHRASASAMLARPLANGVGLSLAGDLLVQRAATASGTDLAAANLQPTLHITRGTTSAGLSLSLQRQDVAGARFRTTRALQLHATRTDGAGHWSVLLEGGTGRHPATLAELDLHTRSALLQRHWPKPLPGVDSADVSVQIARERNQQGLGELSSRAHMLTASLTGSLGAARWNAGLGVRRSRFDDTVFPGEPPRTDSMRFVDLSLQWPLGPVLALRADLHAVRNASTTRLYAMDWRSVGLSLVAQW